MPHLVHLEDVEQLAAELPILERLKLVAHICDRLAAATAGDAIATEGQSRQQLLAETDAWLAECDAVAEAIPGDFDSVADVRTIRHERSAPS